MPLPLERTPKWSAVTSVIFSLVLCVPQTVFLLVPVDRFTSRHAANESLSHSSKWCDRLSQPFTSVYFIGCGSRPQIFISFYGCVVASVTKRSEGGRALRQKRDGVESSGSETRNGVECRGRDVWGLLLRVPSRSIFLCLKPRLPG